MLRFLMAVVISVTLIGVCVVAWTVLTPGFRMIMSKTNSSLATATGATGDAWDHGVTFQTGWINLWWVPLAMIIIGFLGYIYMNAQRTEWISGSVR